MDDASDTFGAKPPPLIDVRELNFDEVIELIGYPAALMLAVRAANDERYELA